VAWLKFDVTTPEKPEVLAITIAMGWEDPDLTVGKLLKVWRWFDQHTVEGNARNVTPALFDRLIGVTGLTKAMADVGWLEINEGGLVLPNFETHNGKTAKDRALTAIRVAKSKAKSTVNEKSNALIVSDALPREEKIREEKNKNTEPNGYTSAAKLPTCPTQSVIDLYHEVLPDLPQVRLTNPTRVKAIASLWRFVLTTKTSEGRPRATSSTEALAWIRQYFDRASENDFLMGRGQRSAEHAGWQCDIDFLLSEKGKKQVIEKTRTA
jgi:hypothetical protein